MACNSTLNNNDNNVAHKGLAVDVPVNAAAGVGGNPVNQADRCPVCNGWMNTTMGGNHNCPGKGSR